MLVNAVLILGNNCTTTLMNMHSNMDVNHFGLIIYYILFSIVRFFAFWDAARLIYTLRLLVT